MSFSRRRFLKSTAKLGVASSMSMLWNSRASAMAFAAAGASDYKAVVVLSLLGGNDGNNMIVPMDRAGYANYAGLRGAIALPVSGLKPITSPASSPYGLHPSLTNIATLYNTGKAMVVANIGPLSKPTTKADVLHSVANWPGASLSHSTGINQWESAQAVSTGWGGRVADAIGQSGAVPPVLTTANSIFSVGRSVQAIAVQNGSTYAALTPSLNSEIAEIAGLEMASKNSLVQQIAAMRSGAMQKQSVLDTASSFSTLKTTFDSSNFCQAMKRIALLVAGRSVLETSRQIFYVQQGGYDNHQSQLANQNVSYVDLDRGLGSFFAALDELGMTNQVLVCTHSDFGRTLQANVNAGTDHGWGNHHLIFGGGVRGTRIAGTMPELDLGGSNDLNGLGVWIPTMSVTQMTAGIGRWMGLSDAQLLNIFPDLVNFPAGPLQLT